MFGQVSEFVEMIFNSQKIKFDKMSVLFGSLEIKELINRVNIFINLESILNKLHSPLMEKYVTAMNKKELKNIHLSIISNIINLAGHYRRFFTKNKIKSNIVLFLNEYDKYTSLNNTIFLKHYRERFIYDYTDNPEYTIINNVLKSVIENSKTIIDYIEDVYLVSTNRLESSIIPELLCKNKTLDGQINILITRDEYDLQYVNKNFLVMFPKGEESYIVTKENLFTIIRLKREISVERNLPSYLISFMLSVIGDKRRGISRVKGCGWKTIYKSICKLFKKLDISDFEYINIEHLIGAIKDTENSKNKSMVANNLMCIDIDRQVNMVTETQNINITKQLVNKYENDILKLLNAKYFDQYPLNVIELNQYSIKK